MFIQIWSQCFILPCECRECFHWFHSLVFEPEVDNSVSSWYSRKTDVVESKFEQRKFNKRNGALIRAGNLDKFSKINKRGGTSIRNSRVDTLFDYSYWLWQKMEAGKKGRRIRSERKKNSICFRSVFKVNTI